MPKGTIKRLMERGFGFIKTEEEKDLFFHSQVFQGLPRLQVPENR